MCRQASTTDRTPQVAERPCRSSPLHIQALSREGHSRREVEPQSHGALFELAGPPKDKWVDAIPKEGYLHGVFPWPSLPRTARRRWVWGDQGRDFPCRWQQATPLAAPPRLTPRHAARFLSPPAERENSPSSRAGPSSPPL